ADDIQRIVIQEPPETAVLARLDTDVRLMRFGKEQNHRVVDPLVADLKVEAFVCAEVRQHAELAFLDAGLFFQLAKRGVDGAFARLEVALREIPVVAASVEQEELYAVGGFAIDDEAGHDLF